ncbi:MAG: DegV family protein, partial [Lachnospiraceae bacterium]|nr:DegV family protein [Lachnospiraceae bacterium]
MKPYVEEGRELVCFSISDDMSTSGNVMRLAAEELQSEQLVRVINSENLSTGIGLQVIEAAIMAQEGKGAEMIVQYIENLRSRVRASFVVDTLTYLHRGGRCSGLAAMAGGALKLHPRIVVEEGKMKPGKKYRGGMNKVIMSYAKDMEEDLKRAKKERVFITHSGCHNELVDDVKTYLKSLGWFDEILETMAGGVISSHCGPGTLGVLFIEG